MASTTTSNSASFENGEERLFKILGYLDSVDHERDNAARKLVLALRSSGKTFSETFAFANPDLFVIETQKDGKTIKAFITRQQVVDDKKEIQAILDECLKQIGVFEEELSHYKNEVEQLSRTKKTLEAQKRTAAVAAHEQKCIWFSLNGLGEPSWSEESETPARTGKTFVPPENVFPLAKILPERYKTLGDRHPSFKDAIRKIDLNIPVLPDAAIKQLCRLQESMKAKELRFIDVFVPILEAPPTVQDVESVEGLKKKANEAHIRIERALFETAEAGDLLQDLKIDCQFLTSSIAALNEQTASTKRKIAERKTLAALEQELQEPSLAIAIETINNGNDAGENLRFLNMQLKKDPALAFRLVAELNLSKLSVTPAADLRNRLYSLQEKLFVARSISSHIAEFNTNSNRNYAIAMLQSFLDKDNSLAKRYLLEMDIAVFGLDGTVQLRDALYNLQPELYIARALPEHITKANANDSLKYYSGELEKFLTKNPKLANRMIMEIDAERFGFAEIASLRQKLITLQPELYCAKMTPYLIERLNEGKDRDYAASWLNWFVQKDRSLAQKLIDKIHSSEFGQAEVEPLRETLFRMEHDLYINKVLPEYVWELSKQRDSKFYSEQLVVYLGREPSYAKWIIENLNIEALSVGGTEPLRNKLLQLEPESYMEKALPHHVECINSDNNAPYHAMMLGHFVGLDKAMADKIIPQIVFEKYENLETLANMLYQVSPDVFAAHGPLRFKMRHAARAKLGLKNKM